MTLVPEQIVLSPSLLDSVAVGLALLVSTTSSVVGAHEPLETVHLSVALLFTGTPVTEVLKEFTLVIVAVPETTLHTPVPMPGLVALSVNVPFAHCAMSAPATDALGVWSNLIVTSSKLGVHTPLLIVHLKT